MIDTLAVTGYRSLRDLVLPLGPLNVVTGANGSGKSSLYRALRLLADVAQGRVIPSLAAEGGLPSALWAGPEAFSRGMRAGTEPVQGTVRRDPVSLKLGFSSDEGGYAIDLGIPAPVPRTLFRKDPEIKGESLWTGPAWRPAHAFAERRGPAVRLRNAKGAWQPASASLQPYDSMLTHCTDPRDAVELLLLRDRLRAWRFYDHLRTDGDAPARRRQPGTRTPVLAADGADLAAAVATIEEIGSDDTLHAAISDAFPGASIAVRETDGVFDIEMRQHGLLRPLGTPELSDGTLRYLLLVAALLSPRPPELLVLNEPETSLHPDLLPPLARLLATAADCCQVVVVSHAEPLAAALEAAGGRRVALFKQLGETMTDGEAPGWAWPPR